MDLSFEIEEAVVHFSRGKDLEAFSNRAGRAFARDLLSAPKQGFRNLDCDFSFPAHAGKYTSIYTSICARQSGGMAAALHITPTRLPRASAVPAHPSRRG